MKTLVIFNPVAGGGRTSRLRRGLERDLKKVLGTFEMRETEAPGDGKRIAEKASGHDLIVACGGDGTIHEVANGLRGTGKTLGIISLGTGGDLIKSLGIPRDPRRQIEVLARGRDKMIDVGQVTYREGGKEFSRLFLNVTDAGLGADVLRRLGESRSLWGRKLAYLTASLTAYRNRKPFQITIGLNGGLAPLGEKWSGEALLVAVANGGSFGGGMRIAPNANIEDGLFDLTIVRDLKPAWLPIALPLLYTGRLRYLPQVETLRAREVNLSSPDPVDLDIDGEPIGSLPARFRILPHELKVRVP